MITNHTAICHKTCVCKYLGLLFMHFSRARSEGSGQQSSTPGTHRSGSAISFDVAAGLRQKGGARGLPLCPWCPHAVRTPALGCSLASWSSQDGMPCAAHRPQPPPATLHGPSEGVSPTSPKLGARPPSPSWFNTFTALGGSLQPPRLRAAPSTCRRCR